MFAAASQQWHCSHDAFLAETLFPRSGRGEARRCAGSRVISGGLASPANQTIGSEAREVFTGTLWKACYDYILRCYRCCLMFRVQASSPRCEFCASMLPRLASHRLASLDACNLPLEAQTLTLPDAAGGNQEIASAICGTETSSFSCSYTCRHI